MATQEKRMGDRFDATLVRDIDPLHWFMPYLYPNRADNEAFIREEFDLTNLEAFLEQTQSLTLMSGSMLSVPRIFSEELRPIP